MDNAKKNAQKKGVVLTTQKKKMGEKREYKDRRPTPLHGGGELSKEEYLIMKKNREFQANREHIKGLKAAVKNGHQKGAVTATQHGNNLTFSRPITHITGFGKYNMQNGMVKPQKVFHSPEHEKDYHKKKEYKKAAKAHQGSGDWWDTIKTGASKAFEIAAPHIISALAGFGDYEVHSNSMLAGATHDKEGSEIPMMCNTKTANIMRHREFICNVLGTTSDFQALTFPIQPGLDETFPWLHLTAQGFTSYKMLGAVMEFNSLYGQITAGGYLGYVAMGTQYNSMAPVFTSKEDLVTSEYANSKRTDQSFMHPLECSPEQQVLKQQYIRSGDLPDNSDLKFYDLGNFTIACGGQATDNAIVGELWITYEVAFFQPKLAKVGANYINADHWVSTVGVLSATPLGTSQTQKEGSTMQGSSIVGNEYHFPPLTNQGIYKFTYMVNTTNAVPATPTLTFNPPMNCSLFTMIEFFAATGEEDFPGAGTYPVGTDFRRICKVFYVRIESAGAFFQFDANAVIGGGSYMDLFVSEIPRQITRQGLIEGSEDWKRRFVQGYQDKTKVSEILENRILTLQNKLNLVKTREEKKKDIEKEDFEYGPRVIKNCLDLYPELSKKDVVNIVIGCNWDYEKSIKQLSTMTPEESLVIHHPPIFNSSMNSEEAVMQLLQQQNPLISVLLVFEIYSHTKKDFLKTAAILYKMSNNVKNGGNPNQYWSNYLYTEKLTSGCQGVDEKVELTEPFDGSRSEESEGNYGNNPNCYDCGVKPKYLHFQRCLDCKTRVDTNKMLNRLKPK